MTLKIRIINGVKSKSVDLFLLFFYVVCLILIKIKSPASIYISYVLFAALIIVIYVRKERSREIVNLFTRFENEPWISKVAGWTSLIAWCSFILIPFLINIKFIYMAKVLLMIFVVLIAISSILTIFILEINGYKSIKKIRLVLFSFISLCYALSSAFSASLFFQISNLDLSSSPWVEFLWKLTAFFVLFSFILQLVTYVIFVTTADKFQGYTLFNILGALMLLTLLMTFVTGRLDVVAYYVLNYSTDVEWRDNFSCGSKTFKHPNEKYFGFDTEKYTVYFSDRNGKWGFDEIKCIKGNQGNDGYTVKNVSEQTIPTWAK